MIEMFLSAITFDLSKGSPVIILTDFEKTSSLPIWVNPFESDSLALALADVERDRPLSHQLLYNTIDALDWKVLCVELSQVEPGRRALSATIHLTPKHQSEDGMMEHKSLESRPMDAIALATRARVPILVSSDVLDMHGLSKTARVEEADTEKFKEFVQNLKASDFNKLSPS